MDLIVTLNPDLETIPELERLAPMQHWRHDRCRVPLDDPLLDEIFDSIKKSRWLASSVYVAVEASFDQSELAEVTHFKPISRGKVIPESEANYKRNRQLLDETPAIGEGLPKIASGWYSKQTTLKGGTIAALSSWTEEWVVGEAVKDMFTRYGFSGLQFKTLRNGKDGAPLEGLFQLYSESILPPHVPDVSIHHQRDIDGTDYTRYVGTLTYRAEHLEASSDFSRTADDVAGWDFPAWVISRRVVEACQQNKIRGWVFNPILTEGSDLQVRYLESFQRLHKLMESNPAFEYSGAVWM